jgi:hypothetical protein
MNTEIYYKDEKFELDNLVLDNMYKCWRRRFGNDNDNNNQLH